MLHNRISWHTGWPASESNFALPITGEVPINSIDDIISISPAVGSILEQAGRIRRRRRPRWTDYERAKCRLILLVGWECRDDRLRSSHAYELAIDAIVRALGL